MPKELNLPRPILSWNDCPYRLVCPTITDYGSIPLGGFSLNLSLNEQEITMLQTGKFNCYPYQEVCWHPIYTLISFYHVWESCISAVDFDILRKLLNHIIPGLASSSTPQFVYFVLIGGWLLRLLSFFSLVCAVQSYKEFYGQFWRSRRHFTPSGPCTQLTRIPFLTCFINL